MDELAEALGIDPVELRRRTLIEDGSVTATGQVLERVAMKETLERAVELIGYGRELPEDEAIGVAVGWWPCFAANARRLREAEPRRHGHDRHRRAGERHRRSDGDADATWPSELGMQPEDFSLLYQDTDAAPWDMGSCGSQTTFNSGRAVIAAAVDVRDQLLDAAAEQLEASRDDLELAGGAVFVKGSPDKSVTIAELAGERHVPRQGCGRAPGGARGAGGGLRRPPRPRVVPCAAADRARGRGSGSTAGRASPGCSRSPPPTTAG